MRNLAGLAGWAHDGHAPIIPARAQATIPERRRTSWPPRWVSNPPRYPRPDALAVIAEWQEYAPLTPETIAAARLTVGKLPASRCNHQRLIVPIYDGDDLVGLRGRAISCDCGKWLAPGGTVIDRYPLWSGGHKITRGTAIMIVENPVDALLVTQSTDRSITGIATFSTAYWTETWGSLLREAAPDAVIVAYDNDLPGNGGAGNPRLRAEMIRRWRDAHPNIAKLPPSRGIVLANKLAADGLPVRIYEWPDAQIGADWRSVLANEQRKDSVT